MSVFVQFVSIAARVSRTWNTIGRVDGCFLKEATALYEVDDVESEDKKVIPFPNSYTNDKPFEATLGREESESLRTSLRTRANSERQRAELAEQRLFVMALIASAMTVVVVLSGSAIVVATLYHLSAQARLKQTANALQTRFDQFHPRLLSAMKASEAGEVDPEARAVFTEFWRISYDEFRSLSRYHGGTTLWESKMAHNLLQDALDHPSLHEAFCESLRTNEPLGRDTLFVEPISRYYAQRSGKQLTIQIGTGYRCGSDVIE